MTDISAEINQIHIEPTLLNNFPGFLPFGFGRNAVVWGHEHGGNMSHIFEPKDAYGNRSFLQFMNDINIAIDEAGIPLTEIERLQTYEIGGDPTYCELIHLMIPVYRSLREQGYTLKALQG